MVKKGERKHERIQLKKKKPGSQRVIRDRIPLALGL